MIGAEIAARLGGVGSAHWSAEVVIDERYSVVGDWIVAFGSLPDSAAASTDSASGSLHPTNGSGLTVIRTVNGEEIGELKAEWTASRKEFGADHPFGIAVVRRAGRAELLDAGCLVGDRFPAAVSLAVAAARAYRGGD